MHLKTRNVNTAFRTLVDGIHTGSIPTSQRSSRNGPVLQIEEPVIITYERPWERVLFNTARDCSPFLHLYESLWMLAGRNDVAPLAYYARQFLQYSDDGETLHGAYGYRWRRYYGYDQLDWIVDELKANSTSRRCVLQMWDGGQFRDYPNGPGCGGREAIEGSGDLYVATHGGKDVPCNVCVFFSVRENQLDMTVINRSNDLVWGALGANVVHFSFLQEYTAQRIGVRVGVYNQISNNLHVYTNNWNPEEWLAWEETAHRPTHDYAEANWSRTPLIQDVERFEKELPRFVEANSKDLLERRTWKEPFLNLVAQPMLNVFHHYKVEDFVGARYRLAEVKDSDWANNAHDWLTKREQRRSRVPAGAQQA